jgi:hypothetical protein
MRLSNLLLRNGPLAAGANAVAARAADGLRVIASRLENLLHHRADVQLLVYEESLFGAAASARSRFADLDENPDVRFALDELVPHRLASVRAGLRPCDDRDYLNLIRFLRVSAEGASYDVSAAQNPADVGDALVRALDDLNDFLLANGFVDPNYDRDQIWLPMLLARAAGENPWQVWESRRAATVDQIRPRFTQDEPKRTVTVA